MLAGAAVATACCSSGAGVGAAVLVTAARWLLRRVWLLLQFGVEWHAWGTEEEEGYDLLLLVCVPGSNACV